MQILLNATPDIEGSGQPMAEHLERVVKAALGRFGERITRVEAHLSDANGAARNGTDDIHCKLEARLVGQAPIVVAEHAGNAHQAIDGAVRKLKRAATAAIEKHDPHARGPAAPADDPDAA